MGLELALALVTVNFRFQNPDVREVPVLLGIIVAVANDECIRNVKAGVMGFKFDFAT
jgi:hypothetical protein